MTHCSNCGKEITDGAKFCPECGTPIYNSAEQRKLEFDGVIHKCPNCGEVLNSFETNCPACGYELRGTKVASSVQKFASELSKATTDDQKILIIRSFPIPNTKEDIFEFMIMASTNITGTQQKDVFDAWSVKFEQSYQKALLIITNDNDLRKIQETYKKTQKKIYAEKRIRNAKVVSNTISKSGGLMMSKILLLIGKSAAVIIGIVLFFMAIKIDNGNENSSMYQLIGTVLLIASAATLSRRDATFIEILIGACSGALSFYLANYLENGSMLQLCGVVVLIIIAVSFFKKLGDGVAAPTTQGAVINEAKIPSKVVGGTSENYAVVELLLIQAGFTNVKSVPLNDLTFGVVTKVGTVDSITINGKELSSYFRRRFDANVPIVITYHSLRK